MVKRTILVHFNGADKDMAALEFALDLAKRHSAQVKVWHVSPDPRSALIAYAGSGGLVDSANIFAELLGMNATNQRIAKEKFSKALERKGIPEDSGPFLKSATFHTMVGDSGNLIALEGRLADLIVMTRPSTNDFGDGLLNVVTKILFKSGRPVLLVPPGEKSAPFNDKTLIAWDSSLEATHAVTGAMPWLGETNWILTETTEKSKSFTHSAQDLADYLENHDIKAEALSKGTKGNSTALSIRNCATILEAGMIVMGAYKHSRLHEMILGGVTAYMLDNSPVPVLLAH